MGKWGGVVRGSVILVVHSCGDGPLPYSGTDSEFDALLLQTPQSLTREVRISVQTPYRIFTGISLTNACKSARRLFDMPYGRT